MRKLIEIAENEREMPGPGSARMQFFRVIKSERSDEVDEDEADDDEGMQLLSRLIEIDLWARNAFVSVVGLRNWFCQNGIIES